MVTHILYNSKIFERTANAERLAAHSEKLFRIPAVTRAAIDPPQKMIDANPSMKAGSISCTLSSMLIFADFLGSEHDVLLYLQDDVKPPMRTTEVFDKFMEFQSPAICQIGETIEFLKEHDGNVLFDHGSILEIDHGNWCNDAVLMNRQAVQLVLQSYIMDFRVIDCHTRNALPEIQYFRSRHPLYKACGYKSSIVI